MALPHDQVILSVPITSCSSQSLPCSAGCWPHSRDQFPTPRTASVATSTAGRSAPSLAVPEVLAMHTRGTYMLCRAPTCHYLSCHHVEWGYTWSSRHLGICPSPLLQAKPFPPAIAFLPLNMAFTFPLKLASPCYSRSGYLNTSCSVCLALFSRRQFQHVQHFLFCDLWLLFGFSSTGSNPRGERAEREKPFSSPSISLWTKTKASSQLRVKHAAWTLQGRPSP